ncbi:hypothetical protein JOD54_000360 [Actinokineospora baliensis]|uniref:DUF7779 domain-containing protein n=1 Tax=Actinokineospora baliensis TaxID=547056 RepID=UPI0019574E2D|nr:tetratricopeptide repeat protein [Actinokineospora baliensis]MBM7770156.1 hypothetical protein [Actinokineospora baliensis]
MGTANDTGGLPCRFGPMPPLAGGFQDRDLPLPAAGECVVLTGNGGHGKTQVATGFAERLWAAGEIGLLAWITAASRDDLVSGYVDLARRLHGTDLPADRAVPWVLGWLGEAATPWLVVLDDLWHPEDLDGLWPPPTGRVLVTTRRQDSALLGHGRRTVAVDLFTPEESRACLAGYLRPELMAGAGELAAELGHLPLAVGQAGAYAADRHLTCERYLDRWRDSPKPLRALFPDNGYRTVATTWRLSITAADELEPAGLAGPLLHIAALLDPNGIPTSVLTSHPVLEYLSRGTGSQVGTDDAWDALSCLRRLSLVSFESTSIRVHALVQRAARESTGPGRLATHTLVAAEAIAAAWQAIEVDTALASSLRANAAALAEAAGPLLWRDGAYRVLIKAGSSLGRAGHFAPALAHFRDLRDQAAGHIDADHPDSLTIRHEIAYWLADTDLPASLTDRCALLEDQIRVLGPDHRHTLNTRYNIAYCQAKTGDVAGGIATLEALLDSQTRALGADHPHTLKTRHELAFWRAVAGDTGAALAEFAALLAQQTRVLGADHPHSLSTRHEIGHWTAAAGQVRAGLDVLESVRVDRVRLLGHEHPHTKLSQDTVAHWREHLRQSEA